MNPKLLGMPFMRTSSRQQGGGKPSWPKSLVRPWTLFKVAILCKATPRGPRIKAPIFWHFYWTLQKSDVHLGRVKQLYTSSGPMRWKGGCRRRRDMKAKPRTTWLSSDKQTSRLLDQWIPRRPQVHPSASRLCLAPLRVLIGQSVFLAHQGGHLFTGAFEFSVISVFGTSRKLQERAVTT